MPLIHRPTAVSSLVVRGRAAVRVRRTVRARQAIGALLPVEVDGFAGRVHVRVDGPAEAPALVLLHGFGGSMHWYGRVVAPLADTYRLVRIDLLGHGCTGGRAADAPLQARMVEAVLAELDLTSVTAVGHSFGADVAVELAEHCARVEGLVIVTQAPDYSDATLPRGRALMAVPVVGAGIYHLAQPLALTVAMAAGALHPGPAGSELAARAAADFRALDAAMFRVVLVDRRDRMARRPLDAQVRDARKPTLVILGGRDHFYGARSAPRYRAAGARVEILAESGHSPLVEQPARIAELIRSAAG